MTYLSPQEQNHGSEVGIEGLRKTIAPTGKSATTANDCLFKLFETLFAKTAEGGVCRPWNSTRMDVGHSLVTLRSLKPPDFE